MSHLAVLKDAQRQNIDHVLIMEDDLTFTNSLIEAQEAVINKLQTLNWDFAYLGHGVNLSAAQESPFQEYSGWILLTHFLAIHHKTIPQLIDHLEAMLTRPSGHPEGGPMHVDGAYSLFRQQHPHITTLIANPNLGFQRPSPSNIVGYRWFDQLPVVSSVLGGARHVKTWYQRNLVS